MSNNKRIIIRDMLFKIYDKGVQNEECNFDFYCEKMMEDLNILYDLESVCDCGKSVDSRYAPCCSLECWHKKFVF